MTKEDDDTLEDVNSLMKMIGGKKKNAPPQPPAAGAPAPEAGDFSALMKKLGMATKLEPAPDTEPVPERARTPMPTQDPRDSLFSDADDQSEPAPVPP